MVPGARVRATRLSCLGIIAAFPGELQPLVQTWQAVTPPEGLSGDAAWQGRIAQTDCVAVAAGMGPESAARACRIAEALAAKQGGLKGFFSIGWAGALSCGLSAGRAYRVAGVIDGSTGERFVTGWAARAERPLMLVTMDHVAQSHEKRGLGGRYGAVLVDMEAAIVARAAQEKGIPFECWKAVSDAQTDLLPDFSRHADECGKLRMPGLLAHLAMRPRYWRSMARIGKNSKIGARALAEGLREAL